MKPLLSLAAVLALAGCNSQPAPAVVVDRTGIPVVASPEPSKSRNAQEDTIAMLSTSVGANNVRFLQSATVTSTDRPLSIEVRMTPLFQELSKDDQTFLKDLLTNNWATITMQRKQSNQKLSNQSASISFLDSN